MPYSYVCPECEGWGRTVRSDGFGTEPCRDPVHWSTTTVPMSGPTAGEALEAQRRDCRRYPYPQLGEEAS